MKNQSGNQSYKKVDLNPSESVIVERPSVIYDERGRRRKSLSISASELEHANRLEKIRKARFLLKITDTCCAFLATVGVILATYEYEVFFDDTNKPHFSATQQTIILRVIVSFTTAILVGLLVYRSVLSYRVYLVKLRENDPSTVNYWKSLDFIILLVDVFINVVHCPPGLNSAFYVSQLDASFYYSADGLMTNWMLLRVYLIFRLFAHYSKWTSEMAMECCEPEGCEAGTIFALKAVFKDKPYTTLLLLISISIVVFGLAVRNFERPYYYGWLTTTIGFQDYSYIWNGMWLIAITMMTVGYGDFYPKTHMGRFVCIIACFWGVFLVSMMVVTLTVSSSFEAKEAKAYNILYRLNVKTSMKHKASNIIVRCMRAVILQNRLKLGKITREEYKKKRQHLRNELQVRLFDFKNEKSKLIEYEPSAEELLRQLMAKIDRDFKDIKDILKELVDVEKKIDGIDRSQCLAMEAVDESLLYTNSLYGSMLDFKKKLISNMKKAP